MSDLIDRDEVIKIIESVCPADDTYWQPGTLEKIRNLSANTPNNTLGALDCVERQDAIDAAIDAADDWDGGCSKERERFIREALEELPSVHPDVPDTNVGDLISRQDAIDAVKFGITYANAINKSTGEVKELFKEGNKALNEAAERLKDLPSVQPERKKGKWTYRDGKPATIGESYSVICSECNEWSEYCTNFCHNCGADMRPQFEEPEINPCRGCEDYDGKGGCKTKGGCAGSRGDSDDL